MNSVNPGLICLRHDPVLSHYYTFLQKKKKSFAENVQKVYYRSLHRLSSNVGWFLAVSRHLQAPHEVETLITTYLGNK